MTNGSHRGAENISNKSIFISGLYNGAPYVSMHGGFPGHFLRAENTMKRKLIL